PLTVCCGWLATESGAPPTVVKPPEHRNSPDPWFAWNARGHTPGQRLDPWIRAELEPARHLPHIGYEWRKTAD
ncbi:MAG: hypothetical protein ACRESQ_04835, partial [Gammaproteobacteria bacterium]